VEVRRFTRGLYDLPRLNRLTGKRTNPDPRKIIEAIARRDQTRMLVDGMTAANDLGLTDAVPAKINVHTDARLRPIRLGERTIAFKPTAPSKLFWARRPAMRVVQAMHWLQDTIEGDHDRLRAVLLQSSPVRNMAARLLRICGTASTAFPRGCSVFFCH
jgi:hypothetical protein